MNQQVIHMFTKPLGRDLLQLHSLVLKLVVDTLQCFTCLWRFLLNNMLYPHVGSNYNIRFPSSHPGGKYCFQSYIATMPKLLLGCCILHTNFILCL